MHRYLFAALISTALLIGSGCSQDASLTAPEHRDTLVAHQSLKAASLSMQQLDANADRDLIKGTQQVFRTRDAFRHFWQRLHADYGTTPPLPKINFDQEMVAAVVLGRRPTGGYTARVDSVRRQANTVHIFTSAVQPGARCVVTQAVTVPYRLVRIETQASEATFINNATKTHSCSTGNS